MAARPSWPAAHRHRPALGREAMESPDIRPPAPRQQDRPRGMDRIVCIGPTARNSVRERAARAWRAAWPPRPASDIRRQSLSRIERRPAPVSSKLSAASRRDPRPVAAAAPRAPGRSAARQGRGGVHCASDERSGWALDWYDCAGERRPLTPETTVCAGSGLTHGLHRRYGGDESARHQVHEPDVFFGVFGNFSTHQHRYAPITSFRSV